MNLKKTSYFVVVLAIISGMSAAPSFGFLGTDKFKQEVDKEEIAIKLTREVQGGGYGVLSTDELKAIIDSGQDFVLIDTMPYEDSYAKNHIPGAEQFLFPIPEMQEWDSAQTADKSIDDFAALLGDDKNRMIVFYCGFVKCTRSHNGALWAVKLGYTNVHRQPGGIFAWKGAGFDVEKLD
jgi:rhodanese-related sulfurtransferase